MAGPWYVNSNTAAVWAATTAVALGVRNVAPTTQASASRKFQVYECTTAGTTGGTEPTWNTTVGGTTSDGTVTWTTRNATTWANAHRFLNHLLMMNIGVVAGDTIFVKNTHSETRTGNQPAFPATLGTLNTPTRILCVSDSNEPATTLATGAVIAASGTHDINSYLYYYGIEFKSGDGVATTQSINIPSGSPAVSRLVFERCVFNLAATAGSSLLNLGERSLGLIWSADFINCDFRFGASGAGIAVYAGQLTMLGGSILGTAPTTLFAPTGLNTNRILTVEGMDLSLVSGTIVNLASGTCDGSTIVFRRCKLHASATLWGGTPTAASGIFRAIMCASNTANYHYKEKTYYGTIDDDSATFLTGGATDGTTHAARKMITTANAKRTKPLYSPWLTTWVDTTGSPINLRVEIFTDSATPLKDNEVWIEALYLANASYPLLSLLTDASSVLAAGANQDSSAASWTNAAANPNAQVCSVTVTPALKGQFLVRLALGKASTTLWYNHAVVQA
jgi:hypothetical protein